MKLAQIRIQSQMAKIQIEQQRGIQEIRQPNAELSIEQPHAKLSMHSTQSKMNIDQTQAWEDMDLMHIFKRNARFAEEGKQAWLEGMARRASQGTELMRIENNGNPIANQAIENMPHQIKPLGITFIPSQFAVKFDYQPSEIDIQVETNKPNIHVKVHRPEHNYHPGKVSISMQQYAQLSIDVVNLFSESI